MKPVKFILPVLGLLAMLFSFSAEAQVFPYDIANGTTCDYDFSVLIDDGSGNLMSDGPYTAPQNQTTTYTPPPTWYVIHVRVYDANSAGNDANVGTFISVFNDNVGDCASGTDNVDWVSSTITEIN